MAEATAPSGKCSGTGAGDACGMLASFGSVAGADADADANADVDADAGADTDDGVGVGAGAEICAGMGARGGAVTATETSMGVALIGELT